MLDFLRKNATGPLGIALIILLVFAFSIWGVGDIFRGYNANILAKIGNREVNAENYLFRFNREINRENYPKEFYDNTKHTHKAIDDAREYAQLLIKLLNKK